MDPNKVKIELKYSSGSSGTVIQQGIISIGIHQGINSHHYFEITLRTDALEDKDQPLLSNTRDCIGKRIKITLDTTIFIGIVKQVSASKDSYANEVIAISGMSPTFFLEGYPNIQSFANKGLGDIVKAALSDFPQNIISFDAKNVNPKYTSQIEYLTQYNESCFQFINRLAFDFGEWFFYDGTDTYFGLPNNDTTVKLALGAELSSFDLALNVDHLGFSRLFYDHQNHDTAKTKTNKDGTAPTLDSLSKYAADASAGNFDSPTTILDYDLAGNDSMQILTDSITIEDGIAASNLVTFNGASHSSDLKIGVIVDVSGKTGDGKSDINYGKYRIIGLSHAYTEGGEYKNQFKAIPQELKFPPGPKGKLKQNAPAQPAKVMDNKDPMQLGRVQVQFYWQAQKNTQTPWIRVLTSHAGDGRGFYFIPEVDEDVMVDFYDGNPDMPYVVGSVYHSKAKPTGVEDKNYGKGIVTVAGNSILISDDDNKQKISIFNAKNKLILDCDSDNGITIYSDGNISMESKKGITITAEEGITLTAKKDFAVSANGKADIKAQQDITVSTQTNVGITAVQKITIDAGSAGNIKVNGGMVDIEGATSAKMAGAMADVEASGIMTIKGSMVMIN